MEEILLLIMAWILYNRDYSIFSHIYRWLFVDGYWPKADIKKDNKKEHAISAYRARYWSNCEDLEIKLGDKYKDLEVYKVSWTDGLHKEYTYMVVEGHYKWFSNEVSAYEITHNDYGIDLYKRKVACRYNTLLVDV